MNSLPGSRAGSPERINTAASSTTASSTGDQKQNKKKGKKEYKESKLYEVDFVGNGTYRVSQLNLLQKRTLEPIQDRLSNLSARGLSHREREHFQKDKLQASNIIHNAMRMGTKDPRQKVAQDTPLRSSIKRVLTIIQIHSLYS